MGVESSSPKRIVCLFMQMLHLFSHSLSRFILFIKCKGGLLSSVTPDPSSPFCYIHCPYNGQVIDSNIFVSFLERVWLANLVPEGKEVQRYCVIYHLYLSFCSLRCFEPYDGPTVLCLSVAYNVTYKDGALLKVQLLAY